MDVLDEYHTLTNTSLYRNDDFWFFEPKNEFEEKLYYSKKTNQKEIIEMIQEEIKRLKSLDYLSFSIGEKTNPDMKTDSFVILGKSIFSVTRNFPFVSL